MKVKVLIISLIAAGAVLLMPMSARAATLVPVHINQQKGLCMVYKPNYFGVYVAKNGYITVYANGVRVWSGYVIKGSTYFISRSVVLKKPGVVTLSAYMQGYEKYNTSCLAI